MNRYCTNKRFVLFSKKTKGVCIMPRGPKRSALEVNKEKLAAVEEKLAKLEETVKALKAEKKEMAGNKYTYFASVAKKEG